MADETVVTFLISQEKYEYLKIVLNNHKDFLYKLGIAEPLKNNLIKDMHIIRSILETGRKEK